MSKRIPVSQHMTPRVQPDPHPTPYVRPKLSELLFQRAEWWATPEDLSAPHVTATLHMMRLQGLPEAEEFASNQRSDWFQFSSWLCLFESNFQITDGEG